MRAFSTNMAQPPNWTPFDCILLDIMMVRTNGVDVALTLRGAFEGSPTPLPPLVAMTANTSAREAQIYKSAGFIHLLAKPFDNAKLRAALHVALLAQSTR